MTAPEKLLTDLPTLSEFEDAARSLRGVISHTPLELSHSLTEMLGVPVHLKLENLQRTGSFKIRGATYRLSRLTEQERARGVVASSSGNHGRALAWAARRVGVPATVVMPEDAYPNKIAACREEEAEVVLAPDRWQADVVAEQLAGEGRQRVQDQ